MKIYILDDADSFLGFANESDYKLCFTSFKGKPMKDKWDSTITLEEYDSRSKKYDISRLCSNPIFSEKSVSILGDLLENKAEILPYRHKTEKYYAINVTKVIDCIDFSKAACVIEPHDKFVKEINKYAFKEKLVLNETIFKIPEFKATKVFVTEEFRQRVIDSGLTGFVFNEVWDSEEVSGTKIAKENNTRKSSKTYDFNKAMDMVEKGKTLASDQWVLQKNNNTFYIGTRENNGEYSWINPVFIPPVLLDLQWYVVDRVEYSD